MDADTAQILLVAEYAAIAALVGDEPVNFTRSFRRMKTGPALQDSSAKACMRLRI